MEIFLRDLLVPVLGDDDELAPRLVAVDRDAVLDELVEVEGAELEAESALVELVVVLEVVDEALELLETAERGPEVLVPLGVAGIGGAEREVDQVERAVHRGTDAVADCLDDLALEFVVLLVDKCHVDELDDEVAVFSRRGLIYQLGGCVLEQGGSILEQGGSILEHGGNILEHGGQLGGVLVGVREGLALGVLGENGGAVVVVELLLGVGLLEGLVREVRGLVSVVLSEEDDDEVLLLVAVYDLLDVEVFDAVEPVGAVVLVVEDSEGLLEGHVEEGLFGGSSLGFRQLLGLVRGLLLERGGSEGGGVLDGD